MKTKKLKINFKLLAVVFVFPMVLTSLSCSGDDDNGTDGNTINMCENDISAILDDLADANSTFIQNPTEANCEALRQVYFEYIDILEGCVQIANNNQYQNQLDEAEQQINALDCSEFE